MSLWIPLAPMSPHYVNHYTVSLPLGYQHRYPAAHRLADGPEVMRVRLFDKDHLKRARRRKAGPRVARTPFERPPATHVVASSATIEYRTSGIKAGDKVALQASGDVTVDVADFEQVAPAAQAPAGAVSVVDRGADPTGQGDSTQAFNSAIAAAIVSLAHNLEIEAVAEGVESVEQVSELQALGCDAAQGYLFAKPMAAADVLPYLDHVYAV